MDIWKEKIKHWDDLSRVCHLDGLSLLFGLNEWKYKTLQPEQCRYNSICCGTLDWMEIKYNTETTSSALSASQTPRCNNDVEMGLFSCDQPVCSSGWGWIPNLNNQTYFGKGELRGLCLSVECWLFGVAAADEQQCEEGWTKFQGNCYLHVTDRETWLDAEQRCRDVNAHLVSIVTPEEQHFVNSE